MEDDAVLEGALEGAPSDWLQAIEQLPERPKSLVEERFKQFFAVDVQGHRGHDMYVYVLANGVCVVGLAPSHPLVCLHRGRPAVQGEQPQPEASAAADGQPALPEVAQDMEGASTAAPQSKLGEQQDAQPAAAAAAAAAAARPPWQHQEGGGHEQGQAWKKRRGWGGRGRSRQDDEDAGGGLGGMKPVGSFPMARLKAVNFEVGRHSRAGIKDSGKKKASQGTMMRPNSCLCRVESEDGECVMVFAALAGRLLEVNSRLITNGQLLFDRPCREGYLAIMYPTNAELKQAQDTLLPVADYLALRGLTPEDML